MKTSLDHLPPRKQRQLGALVEDIRRAIEVELVILFGSHARGDWVEDPVGGYFSDFDVLVVVKSAKAVARHEVWDGIEQRADKLLGQTALSLIVHDIDDVNRQLAFGQYFFSDIRKEGIVLHDAGRVALAEAKDKTAEERRAYARQNYEQWFESADDFLLAHDLLLQRGRFKIAAFNLHQATERYYTAALLVLTEYKPKAHNIDYLGKLAGKLQPSLRDVFPRTAPEDKRVWDLLKKAYIDARYSTKFVVTAEELEVMARRVRDLRERVERVCRDRIEGA
jgi:predicted nucleotidyltransferase/HEPN domain-containing protein